MERLPHLVKLFSKWMRYGFKISLGFRLVKLELISGIIIKCKCPVLLQLFN